MNHKNFTWINLSKSKKHWYHLKSNEYTWFLEYDKKIIKLIFNKNSWLKTFMSKYCQSYSGVYSKVSRLKQNITLWIFVPSKSIALEVEDFECNFWIRSRFNNTFTSQEIKLKIKKEVGAIVSSKYIAIF